MSPWLNVLKAALHRTLEGNFGPLRMVLKRMAKGMLNTRCVQCEAYKGRTLYTHCYPCQLKNLKQAIFWSADV